MTEKHTKDCSVVPVGNEMRFYPCWHEGPVKWYHFIFGHKLEPRDELLDEFPTCPQCMLEEIRPKLGQCVRCGVPLMPGDACIMYGTDLCCLGVECGPGPAYAMPGIWDGEQYIDGVTAGTVVSMKLC